MEIDITCLEASGYISDSVDGQLDPELSGPLQAHLGRCRPCRLELTLVQGTKASLRDHMKPVPTPPDLRRKILGDVSTPRVSSGLTGMFGLSGWRIPLAFAGALGIALIAFTILTQKTGHNHTKPFDGSVVTETFNNFDQVVEGRLTPGLVSENPAEVRRFLEERVHFSIQVPSMKQFRLVGGQFSAVDNETTAHVIYERDGNFIYICQSDARKLVGGKRRFIPAPALAELRRSGWFFTGNVTDCNLAMWLADSTLCTAVADMNRELLLANLTGTAPP
ncbi:MAG TPA: zf-HC2 domain-containing protein [Bacteroidota bacterium]|nr:zf-HC2 domain-containing protein [Bacteroidota bacterium]